MNISVAEGALKRLLYIECEISSLQYELEELHKWLSIDVRYKEVHIHTNTQNSIEQTMTRIIDAKKAIRCKIDDLLLHKDRVSEAIAKMDDRLSAVVLRQRYLNRFTWEEVAESIGQSVRNVHRLHATALLKFEKVWHTMS